MPRDVPLKTKAEFVWDDPLLLDQQLTQEERMVRDAARAYCQDKLDQRTGTDLNGTTLSEVDY